MSTLLPPLDAQFERHVLAAALPQHVPAGYMRYCDFSPLGAGGKAEVFRCTDSLLGRAVALKKLRSELAASAVEETLLVREARTMAALDHPSIPEVFNLGRDGDGRPYFTMTLKAGPTLHDVLSAQRRGDDRAFANYPLERLLGVLLSVGDALDYAHHMNVVHCDLKPENIILGPRERVTLLDWGLAIICPWSGGGGDDQEILRQRGPQGSALYMSPEQARGELRLDCRCDVYGLGVLLYECLTLDTPCRGATSEETLYRVTTQSPCPPRLLAPHRGVSVELQEICLQALAKRPDERFSSMEDFCEVVEEARIELLVDFERSELGAGPSSRASSPSPWDPQRRTDRQPASPRLPAAPMRLPRDDSAESQLGSEGEARPAEHC